MKPKLILDVVRLRWVGGSSSSQSIPRTLGSQARGDSRASVLGFGFRDVGLKVPGVKLKFWASKFQGSGPELSTNLRFGLGLAHGSGVLDSGRALLRSVA